MWRGHSNKCTHGGIRVGAIQVIVSRTGRPRPKYVNELVARQRNPYRGSADARVALGSLLHANDLAGPLPIICMVASFPQLQKEIHLIERM